MQRIATILVTIFAFHSTMAQEAIVMPEYLQTSMDSVTKQRFNESLEILFSDIEHGKVNDDLLTPKRVGLAKSLFQKLIRYETRKDSVIGATQDKSLINCYPISSDKYYITISYLLKKPKTNSVPIYIINLIATELNDTFTFSVPIDYLTRYWKVRTIGNITYYFRGSINKDKARIFHKKNSQIAEKLGLKPEKFEFYMTDNYQEISELLGFGYALSSNGKYRDGYGVVDNTIFAVMNNEDFSHDIFHYYSGIINKRKNRNWIAEEGIAYLWGNAYYTDTKGDIILQQQLVKELKKYLTKNPDTSLFSLFKNNTKIFSHIAPEISVRSTISGIIANHVEQEKGIDGILKLINAGSKDRLNSYLKTTNQLIGLNEDNFDQKVRSFIK